jgi:hypothetical protein
MAAALTPGSPMAVPADKIRFFKEQEEKLQGIDEKKMFASVASTCAAAPVKL